MTAATDWETVYKEFEPKVRAYIQSRVGDPDDVNDLCADVFLSVMRGKDIFSGERKAVSSWIYVITKRTVAAFYRSYRPGSEIPEDMADDTDIEAGVINSETLEELAGALDRLDERLRDIIILHYYGGKALTEIAAATGLSYRYVKMLHGKALSRLRQLIGNL